MSSDNSTRNATTSSAAQSTYEAKVIAESVERVGGCPQIKGTIHEIIFRDSINCNPFRLANGETARLVSDTTAKSVDLVVMKGGRVVERIQLKDAAKSVDDLIRQINSGQYASSRIKVTPETLEALQGHLGKLCGSKSIESSGISSGYTEHLGRRAGAKAYPGAGSVTVGLKSACMNAAKSGGVMGGSVGVGIAVVGGAMDLIEGRKDVGEVAMDVAKGGAVGVASGAAASVAATTTGALAGGAIATGVATAGLTGVAATVAVAAAPVIVAAAVGYFVADVVNDIWSSIFD